MSAITKIFGTHSERELKRIYPLVDKVESYREAMGALSDEELKNKTKEFKERLENGETLDDLLPEQAIPQAPSCLPFSADAPRQG